MDIPSNLEFINENINSELTSLSEYINNDIEEYLTCLATKSESEVINSLKTTVPQITEVFNIITKLNKLIPNIDKLKKFTPSNDYVNKMVDSLTPTSSGLIISYVSLFLITPS